MILAFPRIIIALNRFETVEPTKTVEEIYGIPSMPLWVLFWIFLLIGIVALIVLILYTKYGREMSIKLSIITIIIASTFLGFAFHFFLLNLGI